MVPRPPPEKLRDWALSELGWSDDGLQSQLSMIAGDASNRRYFRLQRGSESLVLVDAPPQTEKNTEFLRVRSLLEDSGIRVPALHAADLQRGYLILEDLGDQMMLPELDRDSVDSFYDRAFDLLLKFPAVAATGNDMPAYDEELLSEELGRFPTWFLTELLDWAPDAGEQVMLERAGARLLESALEQPGVLVHRDFHSRNLMLVAGGELAVIDFQDAVTGPLTYDLVSLLRDCYIRWPQERVRGWALAYRDRLQGSGMLPATDDELFLRWFDLMGLQRHIKVLGTFARLYLRDGKAAYLADLPLVISYVREVLERYASEYQELGAMHDWFEGQLMPRIATQPWSDAQ